MNRNLIRIPLASARNSGSAGSTTVRLIKCINQEEYGMDFSKEKENLS